MRLPGFEYLEPGNLREALEILHLHGEDCKVLAGGTDLLVRMKQRLLRPKYLLSLKRLAELDHIRQEDGHLCIGARTSLASICASPIVRTRWRALYQAARSIGAPSIQHHRGTIGGNLCQDTRCLFYNQSAFWRSGRQPCHKAGGQICYAKEGSDRCRSTHQSDGAPALIALGAKVVLSNKDGDRLIDLQDLYSTKGEKPIAMEGDELLTEIRIPAGGAASSYQRLSYRSAVDFPIVSAGARVATSDARIQEARIVIGAVGSAPLLLAHASESLRDAPLSDRARIDRAAALAMDHASAFAVENVGASVEYRVQMVSVLVKRALVEAVRFAQAPQEDLS